MKHLIFFLLFTIHCVSCRRQTGTLQVIVGTEASGSDEKAEEQLKKRLNFFLNVPFEKINVVKNESGYAIELPLYGNDSVNGNKLAKLFNTEIGNIHFWEAKDNVEMNNYWKTVNAIIREKYGDSAITEWINLKYGNTLPEPEQYWDSILHVYPTSIYLRPNADANGNLLNGSIVGFANSSDTAFINEMFSQPEITNLHFRNLHPCWDFNYYGREKNLCALYVIKRGGGSPGISGRHIVDASAVTQQGQPVINFQFDDVATVEWRKWTRKLSEERGPEMQGKCVAITIGDKVLSAPMVTAEIPNGVSQISGNFTMAECAEIANMIRFPLYTKCKLISYSIKK